MQQDQPQPQDQTVQQADLGQDQGQGANQPSEPNWNVTRGEQGLAGQAQHLSDIANQLQALAQQLHNQAEGQGQEGNPV